MVSRAQARACYAGQVREWAPFDYGGEMWLRYESGPVCAQMLVGAAQRQYRIVGPEGALLYYGTCSLSPERTKRILEVIVAVASTEATHPLGLAPQPWSSAGGWLLRTVGTFTAMAKQDERPSATVTLFRVIEGPQQSTVLVGTSMLSPAEVCRGLDGALVMCIARRTVEIAPIPPGD